MDIFRSVCSDNLKEMNRFADLAHYHCQPMYKKQIENVTHNASSILPVDKTRVSGRFKGMDNSGGEVLNFSIRNSSWTCYYFTLETRI